MSCRFEAPCGNSIHRVVVLPTHTVYECLNGHSLIVGEPPKYATKYHQAQAERKPPTACGFKNCRSLVSGKYTRCWRHRGKTRLSPEQCCQGCGGYREPGRKRYCVACDEREQARYAKEKAVRGSTGAKYLCLECDSPDHRTPDCPIERATLVGHGMRA